ncbi:MAG TPA: hypothetical protein ENK62_07455 [Chromatiales bacterium]|nr:hypothetical protein [Chromatiales bacterium]
MKYRTPFAAILLATATQVAAELPKATLPAVAQPSMDEWSPVTNTVYKTAPFPGTTLVKSTIWTYGKRQSRHFCFFLVKGDPGTVMGGNIATSDILQMSCTQHYVRNTKTLQYED